MCATFPFVYRYTAIPVFRFLCIGLGLNAGVAHAECSALAGGFYPPSIFAVYIVFTMCGFLFCLLGRMLCDIFL